MVFMMSRAQTTPTCQRHAGMFHSSTQREHWTFQEEGDLKRLREQANSSFCRQLERERGQEEPVAAGTELLGAEEEALLCRYYQKKLVELCNLFAPPKWVPLPRTALVGGWVDGSLLHSSFSFTPHSFTPSRSLSPSRRLR